MTDSIMPVFGHGLLSWGKKLARLFSLLKPTGLLCGLCPQAKNRSIKSWQGDLNGIQAVLALGGVLRFFASKQKFCLSALA